MRKVEPILVKSDKTMEEEAEAAKNRAGIYFGIFILAVVLAVASGFIEFDQKAQGNPFIFHWDIIINALKTLAKK